MADIKAIKTSVKLAWPIAIQNILTTMLSMVDIIMVSHLGDASVAAVGLGNRIQFVFLVMVTGLGWSVGVLASQYFGAGHQDKIRQNILMGINLGLAIMLPLIMLSFFYAGDVMSLGSNDNEVIGLGESYLWLTMPSLIFMVFVFVFESALRSSGQVHLPMFLSGMAIIVNIGLNYWLINGGFGVPALGVAGAALATLLARGFHLLLLLLVLQLSKNSVMPIWADFTALRDKLAWKKLAKMVWPMMFGFAIWSLGTLVYQLIYGQLGTQELAVMSVLAPIESVFIAVFFGFASACSIMVGQRLGADDFEQAWLIAKNHALFSPAIGLLLGIFLYLNKSWVFLPFSNLPQATITSATEVFLLIALASWIKIGNMTMSLGVLRAGGEAKSSMYIDMFGMWLVSIPLTALAAFYFQWPLFWVVCTAYSEEVVKGFLFTWRTYNRAWLNNMVKN